MALLTPNQKINSILASDAKNIADHLAEAARRANSMVSVTLGLNDAALTSWLNSMPANEVMELFQLHYLLGEAVNSAITQAAVVLTASGLDLPGATVDVRSVPEKLAAQGRVFAFEDGVFSITTPQPEPPVDDEPIDEEPAPE